MCRVHVSHLRLVASVDLNEDVSHFQLLVPLTDYEKLSSALESIDTGQAQCLVESIEGHDLKWTTIAVGGFGRPSQQIIYCCLNGEKAASLTSRI